MTPRGRGPRRRTRRASSAIHRAQCPLFLCHSPAMIQTTLWYAHSLHSRWLFTHGSCLELAAVEARRDSRHSLPYLGFRDIPGPYTCSQYSDAVSILRDPLYKDRAAHRILPPGCWGCGHIGRSIGEDLGQEAPVHPGDNFSHSDERVGRSVAKL